MPRRLRPEQTPVVGLPDQRLRVVWDAYSGGAEKKTDRHVIGTVVLVILLALVLVATTRSPTIARRNG